MRTGPLAKSLEAYTLPWISVLFLGLIYVLGLRIGLWQSTLLFVGVGLGLCVLLLTASKPAIWVIITVCAGLLGPFGSLMSQGKIPLTLFQIALLCTLFVYVQSKFLSRSMKIQVSSSLLWLAGFLALLFFSSIYSRARGDALFTSTSLIPLVLLVVVISDVMNQAKYFRWMFEAAVLLMAIPATLAVYTFVVNPSVSLYNMVAGESGAFWVMGRQVGSSGDPNQFAMLLVFPLFYLIVQLFIKPRCRRDLNLGMLYHAGAFCLLFGALLTTYSRSAWISLLLGSLAMFVADKKFKRFALLAAVPVLGVIVFSINNLFVQSLLTRVLSVMDTSGSGSAASLSNNSRIILAKAGLDMFRDSYFLGFGYRSFQALAPFYFDLTKTGGVYSPHNISIQLLAELGVVGFVVFYGMVGSFVKEGLRLLGAVNGETKLILLAILGYLAALLVFHQLYPQCIKGNLLWISFGAILAIKNFSGAQ